MNGIDPLTALRTLAEAQAQARKDESFRVEFGRLSQSTNFADLLRAMEAKDAEIAELEMRIESAEKLALACAEAIERGSIGTRTHIDDTLLSYLNIGGVGGPTDVPTWIEQYNSQEQPR